MCSKFPNEQIIDAGDYAKVYFGKLAEAYATISSEAMRSAARLIGETIKSGGWIYSCGNGGSAAISNHLHCDFSKGIRTNTDYLPKINSLSAHIETITAIGNDFSYDDIFSFQLSGIGQPGDLLVTVSSSGNSENIVRALGWARANGMKSIALTGFDGGRSAPLADVNVHVNSTNYGVVEDAHQSIMHILAQFTRQGGMDATEVARVKF